MESFGYLSVLISIVLGLGITQLLSGFGRWLEQRTVFRAYSPAILWAAFLLLVHIQTWWSLFGLRYWVGWTFVDFSLVLLQPILLYLLAILSFPTSRSELDLRANFFLQRPWFFSLLLVLLVMSVVRDFIRTGDLGHPVNLGFHAAFLSIVILALIVTRDILHRILATLALLLLFAYVTVLFSRLE